MEEEYQMSTNKKLFLFFLFIAVCGCQSKNEGVKISAEKRPNIFRVDSLAKDNNVSRNQIISKHASIVIPDTTINSKLCLEDNKSLLKFYPNRDKQIQLFDELRESPVTIFGNESNNEYLMAYQYEGNTENAYSCFEIGYFEDEKNIGFQKASPTVETNFTTESGLSLGISTDDVIHIKGMNFKNRKLGDYTVLTYRIEDYENSPFLKHYNMPGYFIEIRIKEDLVNRITFGFDFP
jgi:hypothetical protein